MSDIKRRALEEAHRLFGAPTKLPNSNSLFEFSGSSRFRIYFRYSKDHGARAFFGLRQADLRQLEGVSSAICLLWDGQPAPVFLPFEQYDEIFREASPASDGQYKVRVYDRSGSIEVAIPRIGKFNADAHVGWRALEQMANSSAGYVPQLTHGQVQTILGIIGTKKGCDVWIPPNDRAAINSLSIGHIRFRDQLPSSLNTLDSLVPEIDAIWLEPGSGIARSLFEVEHSTPIYSGLLRFNDYVVSSPDTDAHFTVVSNEERRSAYVRHIRRPTFVASGLHEKCTFLPYSDVYWWFLRITDGLLRDVVSPTSQLGLS